MYKTNIMKILAYFFIILSLVVMPLQNTYAQSDKSKNIYQNQINWLLDRFKYQDIRGGTTKGLDVVLDTIPSENFMKLQDENLEKKNKDQLAILSMVGEYRVGFEFLETFGSKENYKLDKPYQSWGTEMVIVVKNEPNFISLQHVMMMYFKDQIHYGTFSVISTADLPKKLSTLGIDVNDREEFTWEAFKVRARRNGKNTLPVFLMKQNVLCGIGNYLKAEIIYHSRASVSSPLSDYNDEQLRRVYDACYRIPYECTFGRRQLHVYNRSRDRAGNKVYTVKTPDKRTTHWVPAVCPIDIRTDRPAVECGYTDCSGYGEETTGRAGRDDETDSSDSLYSVEE